MQTANMTAPVEVKIGLGLDADADAGAGVSAGAGPVTSPACLNGVTTPAVERYSAQEAANFFVAPSRNADRNARWAAALAKLWDNRPCEV